CTPRSARVARDGSSPTPAAARRPSPPADPRDPPRLGSAGVSDLDLPVGAAAQLAPEGRPAAEILDNLAARQAREPDVHGNRLFGLVYPTGREDLETLLEEVNRRYLFGNALNPFKFKELAALQDEVVSITSGLVHRTGDGGGSMTSGGTESILMSMLVNRERAYVRGI